MPDYNKYDYYEPGSPPPCPRPAAQKLWIAHLALDAEHPLLQDSLERDGLTSVDPVELLAERMFKPGPPEHIYSWGFAVVDRHMAVTMTLTVPAPEDSVLPKAETRQSQELIAGEIVGRTLQALEAPKHKLGPSLAEGWMCTVAELRRSRSKGLNPPRRIKYLLHAFNELMLPVDTSKTPPQELAAAA